MSQQLGGQQILILKEGSTRTRGRDAQGMNITAAKAVASAVRTTLGPKGMDKMLVDTIGDVVITNDGVTILKEMDIEHPAAKMMVEVAKTRTMRSEMVPQPQSSLPGSFLRRQKIYLSRTCTRLSLLQVTARLLRRHRLS